MKPSVALADPGAGPPVPANVAQMMAASKVAQLTDMLAKLVSALAPQTQVDIARELLAPPAPSPGTGYNFCLECGRPGHFQNLLLRQGINYRGLHMSPPPAGRR